MAANQESLPIKEALRITFSILFHVGMLVVIFQSFVPFALTAHPVLLRALLSGTNRGYIMPGADMEPFKKLLMDNARVSFIMDEPFGQNIDHERFFHDAQNYLAPALLNQLPGESAAIVYCSSQEIANRRLNETGYQWAGILSDGKGLALKKK